MSFNSAAEAIGTPAPETALHQPPAAGRAGAEAAARLAAAPAPLALSGVVTELGGRRVLNEVDLEVSRGRITALVGPSGVGKTLCVRHLAGLQAPNLGTVLYQGRDLATLSGREVREHRRHLGVLFQGITAQGAGLFGSLSVADNLRFALRAQADLPDDAVEERTALQLEHVGLGRFADALPQELSTGMARRAALARALVSNPDVLLLDDLDSGVDGIRLSLLAELLRETQAEHEMSILVTTHDPELVAGLADDVAVLRAGRIRAAGPAEEILGTSGANGGTFLRGDRAAGLAMGPEAVPSASLPEAPELPVGADGPWLVPFLITMLIFLAIAGTYIAIAANHKPG
jgi:phospholipid/cholesterol/gamma-HCH transport system ATP-binding protein